MIPLDKLTSKLCEIPLPVDDIAGVLRVFVEAELASQAQTIAELTAKLDAVRGLAERIRLTRTAWLEQHGVPISQEFVDFATALGELLAILDAPTKPKEARE